MASLVMSKLKEGRVMGLWLCVWGVHLWEKPVVTTLEETIKGYSTRINPVRVLRCERCALVQVKGLC